MAFEIQPQLWDRKKGRKKISWRDKKKRFKWCPDGCGKCVVWTGSPRTGYYKCSKCKNTFITEQIKTYHNG